MILGYCQVKRPAILHAFLLQLRQPTLPEALPAGTDLWNIGESMIVYIGTLKKMLF